MSRLLDAARSVNQTLDPSRLLVRVCEQARRVAGAGRADVFLRGRGEALRLEATYGRPGADIGAAGEGRYAAIRGWAGRPEYGNSVLVKEPLTGTGVENGFRRRTGVTTGDDHGFGRLSLAGELAIASALGEIAAIHEVAVAVQQMFGEMGHG